MSARDRLWWAPVLTEARTRVGDGDKPGAARVARRLLDSAGLPPRIEWEARSIEISEVPRLADLCPSTRLGTLALDVEPGWTRFNPSIASAPGGGARCIVRSANYRIVGGRYERIDGAAGPLVNRHHLCALEDTRTLQWAIEVDDACALRVGHGRLHGFEDLRLFDAGGTWSALATIAEAVPSGALRMARLAIDDDARVTTANLLAGPHPQRIEKNWMPIADGIGDRAVYRVGHTLVVDTRTTDTPIRVRHRAPLLVRNLRGGSQVIPFRGGWLAVVHEAWQWPGGFRTYVHRFVSFDDSFRVVGVTTPFAFVHDGVEFCAGLAEIDSSLVLTAGAQDTEAIIAVVAPEDVAALLEPVGGTDQDRSDERGSDTVAP